MSRFLSAYNGFDFLQFKSLFYENSQVQITKMIGKEEVREFSRTK